MLYFLILMLYVTVCFILPNAVLERLASVCTWSLQEKPDEDHTAIRFCTSWATTQDEIDRVIAAL